MAADLAPTMGLGGGTTLMRNADSWEWGCSNAFFTSCGITEIHGRLKLRLFSWLYFSVSRWGASFGNIYDWFINDFGNWDALAFIGWPDMLQLTALYLSVFVAQAHFARCIYHLQKENIILPAIIFLFALLAVGAGLGQVVLCIKLGEYSKLGATKVTTNLQAAAALVTDILITFGLCWRLNQGRAGIQSTNKILNFLIMTAVNRGVLTIILATLNIILFFTTPGTFDFMLVIFLSDKFYMNSMLAMLNTREYAVKSGQGTVVSHLSNPVYEANPNLTSRSQTISVSTTRQTHYDESFVEMGKPRF
ncbi:Saposin B-type domain-containing protein [Mycena venus]|uniref:Saposin B-type domain-containing protein n=1 Tax=Mycena venus TaxID=2733690 RepID=A0A8H6X8R5_9AGAR|nr:Saposin B-type domain-containing protein [Mycena venus]